MLLSARALLTGVALATLALPVLLPAESPAHAEARDLCLTQHGDPLPIHRSLPSAPRSKDATVRRTVVRVTLSRDGVVTQLALLQASGDARFDAAALDATRTSAFAPAARGCIAIDSTFDYALVAAPDGTLVTAVVPGSADIAARR